jgi:hypothetical protein
VVGLNFGYQAVASESHSEVFDFQFVVELVPAVIPLPRPAYSLQLTLG